MKHLKYTLPAVTFTLWLLNLIFNGVQNGSAYIQHVDGLVLVFGSGALAVYVPKIRKFIERHRELHRQVEHLHSILKKDDDNDGQNSPGT